MDKQTETTNPLKALEQFGQSPWLDFIERQFLDEGKLGEMIERDGLKGMTSNPSIFEKAMGHGDHYDAGFKELVAKGDVDAQTIYETLAIADIQKAADLLRLVYDRTGAWTATCRWRCRHTWRWSRTTRWRRCGGCGRRWIART